MHLTSTSINSDHCWNKWISNTHTDTHRFNALFDALHQLSGTHHQKLLSVVTSDSFALYKSRLKTFLFSHAFSSFSAHYHAAWPQRLWSYDLLALYKSVYYYYYYQKGKTNLDFTEARDSEWWWHQLGHMQVCTSLQTDNHASNPPQPDALPAAQPI